MTSVFVNLKMKRSGYKPGQNVIIINILGLVYFNMARIMQYCFYSLGVPWWLCGKSHLQEVDFHPWVRKVTEKLTSHSPVFLHRKSPGLKTVSCDEF